MSFCLLAVVLLFVCFSGGGGGVLGFVFFLLFCSYYASKFGIVEQQKDGWNEGKKLVWEVCLMKMEDAGRSAVQVFQRRGRS